MIVPKGISISNIIKWSLHHIVWLLAPSALFTLLYKFEIIKFDIPWLPVSVIGTAVAFYVGFKNNQAYDRMWEARKIWGGIVNDSRSWGMMVDGFLSTLFMNKRYSNQEIHAIKQRLIYRHIVWLYAHRSQLLIPTSCEHISLGDYSENPFQGMANDIPMLSLCRTIEIDLREMLGETDLPPAVKAKKDILM